MDTKVTVVQRFTVPAETIFDAWLDPKMIGQFMFGPNLRNEEILRIKNEPRVGGSFSFLVRRGNDDIDHVGNYLEMDRPKRLAFTWGVDQIHDGSSKVTIDIEALKAGGCELKLTHHIPSGWESYAERVREAWSKMIAVLVRVSAQNQ